MLGIKPNTPDSITGTCFNDELIFSAKKNCLQLCILAEFQVIATFNDLIAGAVPLGLVEGAVSTFQLSITKYFGNYQQPKLLDLPSLSSQSFGLARCLSSQNFLSDGFITKKQSLPIHHVVFTCRKTWGSRYICVYERTLIPLLKADFWIRSLVPEEINMCCCAHYWQG